MNSSIAIAFAFLVKNVSAAAPVARCLLNRVGSAPITSGASKCDE